MQPCKRIACHGRYDDTPLEFGVPYMCTNPLVAPRPFWRIDQNHLSNLGMLSQVSAGSMWACWERRCQISMLLLSRIALQHCDIPHVEKTALTSSLKPWALAQSTKLILVLGTHSIHMARVTVSLQGSTIYVKNSSWHVLASMKSIENLQHRIHYCLQLQIGRLTKEWRTDAQTCSGCVFWVSNICI
jgi:hypothetical protein